MRDYRRLVKRIEGKNSVSESWGNQRTCKHPMHTFQAAPWYCCSIDFISFRLSSSVVLQLSAKDLHIPQPHPFVGQ